jgi:hypothetical protein
MYTRKLALLALVLDTAVTYTPPAASKNPESLAARPIPRTIEDPRTPTVQVKKIPKAPNSQRRPSRQWPAAQPQPRIC